MMHCHAPRVLPLRFGSLRRAFTTIEVLGVVVISVVLSIVAIAGMNIYQRDLPLRSAAGQLTHAVAAARSMAIARNSTFTLTLDRRTQNFWIDETDAAGNVVVPKVVNPERFDRKIELIGVIPAGDDVSKIRFFSDGSSDNAYLHLLPVNKRQFPEETDYITVRIYGPTGQARVFENQRLEP